MSVVGEGGDGVISSPIRPICAAETKGLCACGCGQRTKIPTQSNASKGWVKGRPMTFVRGHNARLEAWGRTDVAAMQRARREEYELQRKEAEVPWGRCFCGCGDSTHVPAKNDVGKGWVQGVPTRFLHGHYNRGSDGWAPNHGRKPTLRIVEEDRSYLSPCWIWQGATNKQGYGRLYADGRDNRAHRYWFEQLVGPIPQDHDLDHLCRVKPCANPDHLEPVTGPENTARHWAAKRAEEASCG